MEDRDTSRISFIYQTGNNLVHRNPMGHLSSSLLGRTSGIVPLSFWPRTVVLRGRPIITGGQPHSVEDTGEEDRPRTGRVSPHTWRWSSAEQVNVTPWYLLISAYGSSRRLNPTQKMNRKPRRAETPLESRSEGRLGPTKIRKG